ncbi:hypothetical protein [Actinospica robiniae]|uniref:hypothetical protein n=1 Tax=Actinospica robiniae TaxID=304901 RepID=UPI0003FB3F09|nr:hypothetical protein [Actinospica robiniae]
MRWGRRAHKPQETPDTADTGETYALQEARKGTAAEHPAIVVTPDKKAHSGAFVDGVFVEARESSYTEHPPGEPERHERDVAAGEVPGENETMKDKWWVGRGGGPNVGGDEEG